MISGSTALSGQDQGKAGNSGQRSAVRPHKFERPQDELEASLFRVHLRD